MVEFIIPVLSNNPETTIQILLYITFGLYKHLKNQCTRNQSFLLCLSPPPNFPPLKFHILVNITTLCCFSCKSCVKVRVDSEGWKASKAVTHADFGFVRSMPQATISQKS